MLGSIAHMLIDSGSPVNVIDEITFKQMNDQPVLSKPAKIYQIIALSITENNQQ